MIRHKREIGIINLTATAILGIVIFISSCGSVFAPDKYSNIQAELDGARNEIDELSEELVKLDAEYQRINDDYTALQNDYLYSQESYRNLVERMEQSDLTDVGWTELKQFLEADNTDSLTYTEGSFDCSGFTITLRDNATSCGIRCAYVEIEFFTGNGHALNAFETTDMGLIYIDNTNADQVAYVEIEKPYGRISMDGVNSRYISCNGDPSEFYDLPQYMNQSNPFRYSYYLDYQDRVNFYSETIRAYNEAVDSYNNGSRNLTYEQLSQWLDNIGSLGEELGSAFYQNGEKVKNIETYWN